MRSKDRLQKVRLSWLKYFKKTRNIAKTCRHFGISRATFYLWSRRYENKGKKGLENILSRSKKTTRVIPKAVIKALIKLRRKRLAGPKKIANLLKEQNINISPVTVYRILKKFRINKMSKMK